MLFLNKKNKQQKSKRILFRNLFLFLYICFLKRAIIPRKRCLFVNFYS